MGTESASFLALDERIQRFIWSAGWTGLRDAQERAIPTILAGDKDVIIAAATAEGKTEAAFLPALTYALKRPGSLLMYVGPLKALINDQFGRLELLCQHLDVPVYPWHGDVLASAKAKFLKRPEGVLLITPESLEATLCNKGSSIARIFQHTVFVIIDELHAFIGTERGKQLQSQLHRIEAVLQRKVPRIGLSATLGDMHAAADFLRSDPAGKVAMVISESSGRGLKVLIKGFEEPLVLKEKDPDGREEPITPGFITQHLFEVLRGSNNLVFPNSRRLVEEYTHRLSRLCAAEQVPNEFWPHHGSLSKEIREEAEQALKQHERPATAICTNTLELGIDLGSVKAVVQIDSPPSVAGLRQRLGRSGRRKGEDAILRGYQTEDAIGPRSTTASQLRLGTVQTAAMISLLLEKWFEPPPSQGAHFSTLVQQLLSFIAQNGGMTARAGYELLCSPGAPFQGLEVKDFVALLRHLREKGLLHQDPSGLILHGPKGEKMVNHYTFYAAFSTDEEFRIVAGQRVLGSIPISMMITEGQFILFAGRNWQVVSVDEESKTIHVSPAGGGGAPLFSSGIGRVHSRVRQRMQELLEEDAPLPYLDGTAARFLNEGRATYHRLGLKGQDWSDIGADIVLWTWLGDGTNEALAALFQHAGLEAQAAGPGVEIRKGSLDLGTIRKVVLEVGRRPVPQLDDLLANARNLRREKWDWALPDHLLRRSYAGLYLDLDEAMYKLNTLA